MRNRRLIDFMMVTGVLTALLLGTTVAFDIVPSGSGTELRFRHAGLTPQLECWDDCFAAWTHFMVSIETFAQTGTGTPFEA